MKTIKFSLLALLFVLVTTACGDDDGTPDVIYDVNYTVTAENGATINSIQYRDDKGDLIDLTNASSPWSIDLDVRAGLGLEAVAFGDIPYEGVLTISATWGVQGETSQSETIRLPNDTPNSTINNGEVRIDGRTLPRE